MQGITPYRRELKTASQQLRKEMTQAEQYLWTFLRKDQLGVRFYRQKPIFIYIVDFYCPAKKLVVEVDGEYHNEPMQAEQDAFRDKTMQEIGLTVLRFSNYQVLSQIDLTLDQLKHQLI